jgi:predicted Zn-dependent protease
MRGPWTSGGIEYNLGLIGHSPSTATPVDYITRENADGSVSCIVGNMDLPSRTEWRVEIRLPKDKAYFETIPLWYNSTPLSQSYYCFMTGAAAVSDDLEFFYPGNQSLEHEGERKTWPVQDGHIKSNYYDNAYASHTSIHIVGEYNDFMGGYFHKSEFGFGHWALYDEMPGRKLWLWALSREGEIWKDLLTDTHGQYMEFQAGRTFNQYSQSPFRSPIKEMPFNPGVSDRWKEIWFPVKEIGGLLEVSPKGILNVVHENGKLEIGINSLAFADAKLIVKSNEKTILTETRSLKPMEVYRTSVPLDQNLPYEVIVQGMDLRHGSENRNLLKRPFTTTIPADTSSASGYYQEGIELKENRNYNMAKSKFRQCLIRDPLYVDAMVALCELNYRSFKYDSALFYANNVLQLDAYHPAANYYAGITYHAQGDLVNALETLGWAARAMEFRSAAYAQMAGIELQLHNLDMAEHYANQSVDYNRYNFKALQTLAIKYRLSGETELAKKTIESILNLDPLNHFASFERFRLHSSSENLSAFKSGIKNEFQYQTYLELATGYFDLGLTDDAFAVLENAPKHALVSLWKAYLQADPSRLNEVIEQSPAFVFPYRSETVSALAWAVSKSSNWKFKYYLALNYWAIDRVSEASTLFQACDSEPDFAPFYTSRANLISLKDKSLALADLQKARQLDPSDWRNWNTLIEYFEKSGDTKTALTVSTEAVTKFKGNFNLALQYARVQLNNNQYTACIRTLQNTVILPFEGSLQGKFVYEQAYMFLAIDLIKNKKYKEALANIQKSKAWPENLGVGSPFEPDNRLQNYLEVICLDKMKKNKEAILLRDSILIFTKTHYSDTRPTFNNMLALWILQSKGDTESGNELIEKIKELQNSSSSINRWIVASYTNDQATADLLENELVSNNYLKILKQLKELEKQ